MERDIGKITKNETADIIIRIDDFGGKTGLTIREFVSSPKYTGFTKAGVRIQAADFLKFREMINSIPLEEMKDNPSAVKSTKKFPSEKTSQSTLNKTPSDDEVMDY